MVSFLTKNLATSLVVALTAIGLILHAWYWTELPDRIATHFGIDGSPNQWMSKGSGTLLLVAIQIGLPMLFLGIARLLARLPSEVINIPHREYWLHPERRAASLSHMTSMLGWIAVLIALELLAIVHITFLANRSGTPLNSTLFMVILFAFLLAVFTVAGRSMWHFRLPK